MTDFELLGPDGQRYWFAPFKAGRRSLVRVDAWIRDGGRLLQAPTQELPAGRARRLIDRLKARGFGEVEG